MRPRRLRRKLSLALTLGATALLAAAGIAQTAPPPPEVDESPALDLRAPRQPAPVTSSDCRSVVLRACAAGSSGPSRTRPEAGGAAPSLAPSQTVDQVLERVVIERDRPRPPPTVREVIETATARRSWREFESGEGGRCTCASPCPPWPLACCSCTKGGRDAMIDNVLRH